MKTTFAVTKTFAVELTNAQIAEMKEMGRSKVMEFLGVNESQARKIVAAIKSGELDVAEIQKVVKMANEMKDEIKLEKIKLEQAKLVKRAPSKFARACFAATTSFTEFVMTWIEERGNMTARYVRNEYLRCLVRVA